MRLFIKQNSDRTRVPSAPPGAVVLQVGVRPETFQGSSREGWGFLWSGAWGGPAALELSLTAGETESRKQQSSCCGAKQGQGPGSCLELDLFSSTWKLGGLRQAQAFLVQHPKTQDRRSAVSVLGLPLAEVLMGEREKPRWEANKEQGPAEAPSGPACLQGTRRL